MPANIEQAVTWVLVVMALFLAGNHLLLFKTSIIKKQVLRLLGAGAIVAAALLGWSLTDAVYPF